MKLIREIHEQVNLINEVLIYLEQSVLLENQDFILDEMTSERYLKLKYTSQIHINCTITLTPYGTQVDVDRAIEIYYVGMEYINNNKIEYKAFFQTLLTSKIKVEYCGSNYTKIYFYNDIGIAFEH